jgi:hypothetical protein
VVYFLAEDEGLGKEAEVEEVENLLLLTVDETELDGYVLELDEEPRATAYL